MEYRPSSFRYKLSPADGGCSCSEKQHSAPDKGGILRKDVHNDVSTFPWLVHQPMEDLIQEDRNEGLETSSC